MPLETRIEHFNISIMSQIVLRNREYYKKVTICFVAGKIIKKSKTIENVRNIE